jgi:hypothetical protein
MTTYVLRNGVLVEKDKAAPLPSASRPQRHISDNMEATWHPASGRYFSSKSRFRGHTKEMGCIEVGNSMPSRPERKWVKPDKVQRVRDIQRAIYQLQNR